MGDFLLIPASRRMKPHNASSQLIPGQNSSMTFHPPVTLVHAPGGVNPPGGGGSPPPGKHIPVSPEQMYFICNLWGVMRDYILNL